ncbi:hypothetical protein [Mycoplasmopsis cynos]|uniref:hypothetical protein n=1 Tax=Mycoplasmopsis cynos TaxID=171284 RepID=UPI001CB7A3A3|nr:hypothetical protein [Mycoplasmopsis cynos]
MKKIEHLSSYLPQLKNYKITNDEEQENFGINQNRSITNTLKWTVSNQPILFYSDVEFQKDKTVYYPNQNVNYKLHDG